MISAPRSLSLMREHYTDETKYAFGILLGSTSAAEANIALDLLLKSVPERTLVEAINLRELLRSLPVTPFTMAVDEATLEKVGGLEKRMAHLQKRTGDDYEIILTTAGNLVLDLIVKDGNARRFWTSVPVTTDHVNPDLIRPLLFSDCLLGEVVDLIIAMGIAVHPPFHMSLEDWHLEHASEALEDLRGFF